MKFKYDLYRPKKVIKDAWKANSAYFRAKDIRVTPLTKIGDADEIYKSQSTGRIPALAQRFKRKRLTLSETLPSRKTIFVRSAGRQERIKIPVSRLAGTFAKRFDASVAKSRIAGHLHRSAATARKELPVTAQKSLLARSAPVLSYLLLAIVMIGVGAGSVYAYIGRPNTARTDSTQHASNQAKTQDESLKTQKDNGENPQTTPEPPAPSAPAAQTAPQNIAPNTSILSGSQPSPSEPPREIAHSNPATTPAPAPIPQVPSNTTPPAPTPPPSSTPVNPPDTSPETPSQPEPEPITPPSDDADPPQIPDENQQEPNTDTGTDEEIDFTTPSTSNKWSNIPLFTKDHVSSDQEPLSGKSSDPRSIR